MKKLVIFSIAFFFSTLSFAQGWSTLYSEGQNLLEEKKYRQAARALQKAFYEAGKDFGEKHANYRNTASLLAKAYYEDRNFENSSQFYKNFVE